MFTNREIKEIAMRQSAEDIGCRAEDFLSDKNIVCKFHLGENARKYYQEPITANLVSYGNNVVAAATDEVKDLIDASLKQDGQDKSGSDQRYIPVCPDCGGIIKPDVVLYEEGLDDYTWNRSVDYIQSADMLIVGGTSLVVYPAAGLVNYYRGNKLVLINKSTTPFDEEADLVLHMGLGEVFGQLSL